MRQRHRIGYTLLVVLSAAVGQLGVSLASGQLPIPASWSWVVPILSATVTALSTQLPTWSKGTPRK